MNVNNSTAFERIQARQDRTPEHTSRENRIVTHAVEKLYRISGHETFPCRYTWLPKAVRSMEELFSDDEDAMVALGVGKNMVRSIRFWSQVAGMVTVTRGSGYSLTKPGSILLGEGGLDPFLE